MLKTFTDSRCLDHVVPAGYPEVPERLGSLLDRLRADSWPLDDGQGHAAAGAAVAAVHDESYLERFGRAVERGFNLLDTADNPLSENTWAAAWAAVETTLRAVDWMVSRQESALAAVRPPGHHAERDMAMGFCYLNNIAVAADYLVREHKVERVAIFDFDVHHGNGTQHIFEERADVLYASTHQYPFYPGTGAAHEKGVGEGVGTTINLPLPAGIEDVEFFAAVEGEILPALRSYAPEVILLSAGFDSWARDPVGGMHLSEEAFARIGSLVGELAEDCCPGRVLAVLEGGYDLRALPDLVQLHLRSLAGE